MQFWYNVSLLSYKKKKAVAVILKIIMCSLVSKYFQNRIQCLIYLVVTAIFPSLWWFVYSLSLIKFIFFRSSVPRPVKLCSDQYIFQFLFQHNIKINSCNLIRTSKVKFSFRGLITDWQMQNMTIPHTS